MASIGHVAVGLALGRHEAGRSSARRLAASMVLFSGLALLAVSSHGLLDALTDGGLGAFLPFWAYALWPRRRAALES